MDFSRLPCGIFLQIFNYLPFQDRIRAGNINRTFREISQLAISGTKCLDLGDSRFRILNADQLAVILDLCSPNLERIKFPECLLGDEYYRVQELAITFVNYHCPRLTDVDLRFAPIGNAHFGQLIENNPKLESIIWNARSIMQECVVFPDVMNNNLKTLKLDLVDDVSLQSMTDRCPVLKDLELATENITANVLDQFFASAQQLRRIHLYLVETDIVLEEQLVNMWNLPLTSLVIMFENGQIAEDGTLVKVATSFPNLQRLAMFVSHASNVGIGSLGDLQDLEELELDVDHSVDDNDDGIRRLAMCKKLRKLDLTISFISPGTLIALLRGCPNLEKIIIEHIVEVDSPEEAAGVLECLSGLGKRNVSIGFHPMSQFLEGLQNSIWESEPVKEIIKALEENEGLKIKIGWAERQFAMVGVEEDQ